MSELHWLTAAEATREFAARRLSDMAELHDTAVDRAMWWRGFGQPARAVRARQPPEIGQPK